MIYILTVLSIALSIWVIILTIGLDKEFASIHKKILECEEKLNRRITRNELAQYKLNKKRQTKND